MTAPAKDPKYLNHDLVRVCPECAGPILRGTLCIACAHCGWGHCNEPPKPVPAK